MPKSRSTSIVAFSRPGRWTAAKAKAMLAAARQSGLTLYGFATREGLDPQRLYWWRRRLREAVAARELTFEEVPREVKRASVVRGDLPDVERFEIVVRGGRVVRVGATFDGDALRRLLAVLEEEEAPC